MTCSSCQGKDGKLWAPFEGFAPHEKVDGVVLYRPKEEWPDNFVLDVTSERANWGMFYCPTCRDGLDAAKQSMKFKVKNNIRGTFSFNKLKKKLYDWRLR